MSAPCLDILVLQKVL